MLRTIGLSSPSITTEIPLAKIGIVGSEGAKFTPDTELAAKAIIATLIRGYDTVVSGGCHLGGIDIWAKEIATEWQLPFIEFLPAKLGWSGGYKERNLQIAQESDIVVCITVKNFPPDYTGMRFPYCYHCKTSDHIKSGGCWTVKQALKLGKKGRVIVVE